MTVRGVPGVFTPLVGRDRDDAVSTANVHAVLGVLRDHIAQLQSENEDLRKQLDLGRVPATSAADFAAGLQHSLDDLQAKLADMGNEVSNFAVREFVLETKVHVDVSDDGKVGYRFVKPGDPVNASALSSLALTLVPMPKPLPPVELLSTDHAIEALPGLTQPQVDGLRAMNITTVTDFQRVATHARTKAAIVSLLGVNRDELGRYVLLASLLQVPGLDRQKAAVLFDAGIPDAKSLAAADAEKLLSAYGEAAGKRDDDDKYRPSSAEVAGWIEAAKRIVTDAPDP